MKSCRRTGPTSASSSGTSSMPRPALVSGYSAARRRAVTFISSSAAASVAPAFKRPTTRSIRARGFGGSSNTIQSSYGSLGSSPGHRARGVRKLEHIGHHADDRVGLSFERHRLSDGRRLDAESAPRERAATTSVPTGSSSRNVRPAIAVDAQHAKERSFRANDPDTIGAGRVVHDPAAGHVPDHGLDQGACVPVDRPASGRRRGRTTARCRRSAPDGPDRHTAAV